MRVLLSVLLIASLALALTGVKLEKGETYCLEGQDALGNPVAFDVQVHETEDKIRWREKWAPGTWSSWASWNDDEKAYELGQGGNVDSWTFYDNGQYLHVHATGSTTWYDTGTYQEE